MGNGKGGWSRRLSVRLFCGGCKVPSRRQSVRRLHSPQMSAGGRVLMVKSLDCMCRAAVPAGRLVVYLFDDAAEESSTGAFRWEAGQGSSGGPLTAREVEVLRYLALGWDVAHIATEMGMSPHTVRNHSTNLRRKLDVRSSLEAVMAAVRLGVLTFDEDRRETDGS